MICLRPLIFFFILTFTSIIPVSSEELSVPDQNLSSSLSKKDRQWKILQTTMAGVGLVSLWGVLEWDYFTRSPHSQAEGWFGNDTDDGGTDKLGHTYGTYVFSHGLSALYEHWGLEREEAAFYGAFSSFAVMGYMELGDSFSDYGFSYEDMLANSVGALLGYFLYKYENLADKIDFRWEYGLQPNKSDFLTDYDNSKFLLALKLNGFEGMENSLWRPVEFHLGYYSRGFDVQESDHERNIYFGIGLNLTDLLSRNGWTKTGAFLRYMQLPYTSIVVEHDFN